MARTEHNAGMPLILRFFGRFIGDFMKTVKEDRMSYAAIPATLLWFVFNARDIHLDIWTVIGPLIFGASFVVCQHAWSAAKAVIRDIDTESLEQIVSTVLDASGNHTTTVISRPKPHFYRAKLYGVFALVAVLCLLASLWSVETYRKASLTGETKSPAPLPTPTVLIRYEPGKLPIVVPPKQSVYIFGINPKIIEGVAERTNNDDQKTLWWPTKPPKKDELALGEMFACYVTNDSDESLLDLELDFTLHFYSVAPIKASAHETSPGKAVSVTFNTPGADKSAFAAYWKGKIIAGKTGDLLFTQGRPVHLYDLPGRSSRTIYLVNQSELIVQFGFPETASAILDGHPDNRVRVALVRPPVNVMDTTPWWGLSPTLYSWDGIPEAQGMFALQADKPMSAMQHARRQTQ